MDNWDHLVEEDLKQAATVIATFVWNTSQRDERMPRKPSREKEKEEKREKAAASSDYKELDLAGDWKYEIEVPGMTAGGIMIVKKNGDAYDIDLTNDQDPDNTITVSGVKNIANSLKFDFDQEVQGMKLKMTMDLNFTPDKLEGDVTAGTFGAFPVKGTKTP